MQVEPIFFVNAAAFGLGLAMDAFSVSLANGLNEPKMGWSKVCAIAWVFAVFQTLMPLTGWFCVHTIATLFTAFQRFIPWIALILLGYIGGKMLLEGFRKQDGEILRPAVTFGALLVQGVATSIDALSVGFTIAAFSWVEALVESLIIGGVTFFICVGGLLIGKRWGARLAGKASIFGGVILLLIGLEIFLSGLLR